VAEALSALGLAVDLLAAKANTSTRNVHVLCGDVPGKRVRLTVFGRALRRHLAQNHYDIVHSVLPFDFADLYQPRGGTYAESRLRHIASYPGPIVRLCKRATTFANWRRSELLSAERRVCQGAHGPTIAALSHYVADQFRRHYATDPQRIVLTLNGVKIGRPVDASAIEKLRGEIMDRLGVPDQEHPVLLLFAAHNPRLKGFDPLLRALRQVQDSPGERPACLIVAGSANSSREHRLAQRLGLESHIVFLGPVKNIRDALGVADVGILPTFYDPSSRFILEALAAAKPVITTRFNGAVDHFTAGRHGQVIDAPDDVPALAQAIRHFTSTARLQEASQAILADHLADRISIERVARDLLGIYNALDLKREPV
jgi:glycosyltransferase involved in cell wall biosynthesis